MWTPRRNISAKKDSSWLTGPEFITGVQQSMLKKAFHTVHFRGKPQIELPAFCTIFLPSELILIKEFPVSSFIQ